MEKAIVTTALRRAAAVLAALTVLAAAAVAVLAHRVRQDGQAERAGSAALAAAQLVTPEILSYDYRRLDANFASARRHLTGRFADDYARTTSTVVTPSARKQQAVVRASVAGASVVSAAPDRVVVLMFVNQTTTSNRARGPRLDLNRVRMTLRRAGGQWRVSDVDAL